MFSPYFFSPYTITERETSSLNASSRCAIAQALALVYPNAQNLIMNSFVRYERLFLCYRKKQLMGLCFFHYFSLDKKGYFYFGPLFFIDRTAFAVTTSTAMHRKVVGFRRVYFLAEIQNPEVIIHLHASFKKHIEPKAFSFAISEHSRAVLKIFKQYTPQLDDICEDNFCSYSKETIYQKKRHSQIVCDWLKIHGIDLANNQALVVVFSLTRWRLIWVQIKIIATYLWTKNSYLKRKLKYLEQLTAFLRGKYDLP